MENTNFMDLLLGITAVLVLLSGLWMLFGGVTTMGKKP